MIMLINIKNSLKNVALSVNTGTFFPREAFYIEKQQKNLINKYIYVYTHMHVHTRTNEHYCSSYRRTSEEKPLS